LSRKTPTHRIPTRTRHLTIGAAILAAAALAVTLTVTLGNNQPARAVFVAATPTTATYTPPAAVPAPPVSTPATITGWYLIRAGDTLGGIATRECGNATAYPALAQTNRIADPNLIYPGQRIQIICTAAHAQTLANPTSTTTAQAASRGYLRAPILTSNPRLIKVLAYALAKVGDRYVFGTAGPGSFDCSGLTMMAYRQISVYLPHYSISQMHYGRPVSRANLQPGDLVFPIYGHVQIYIGNGRVVEAANPSVGVRIGPLWRSFITARRLV
jgi:cell wall-associated NlpC family hydrolase